MQNFVMLGLTNIVLISSDIEQKMIMMSSENSSVTSNIGSLE